MIVGQLVISIGVAALVASASAIAGLGALGALIAYAVAAPTTLLLLAARTAAPVRLVRR